MEIEATHCHSCLAIPVARELYYGGLWLPVCSEHATSAVNEGRLLWVERKPSLEARQRHLSRLSHGNSCPCSICTGRKAELCPES